MAVVYLDFLFNLFFFFFWQCPHNSQMGRTYRNESLYVCLFLCMSYTTAAEHTNTQRQTKWKWKWIKINIRASHHALFRGTKISAQLILEYRLDVVTFLILVLSCLNSILSHTHNLSLISSDFVGLKFLSLALQINFRLNVDIGILFHSLFGVLLLLLSLLLKFNTAHSHNNNNKQHDLLFEKEISSNDNNTNENPKKIKFVPKFKITWTIKKKFFYICFLRRNREFYLNVWISVCVFFPG